MSAGGRGGDSAAWTAAAAGTSSSMDCYCGGSSSSFLFFSSLLSGVPRLMVLMMMLLVLQDPVPIARVFNSNRSTCLALDSKMFLNAEECNVEARSAPSTEQTVEEKKRKIAELAAKHRCFPVHHPLPSFACDSPLQDYNSAPAAFGCTDKKQSINQWRHHVETRPATRSP